MKALIIGGTGTISGAVSRELLAQGWELYHLNRGTRPMAGAHQLTADAWDENSIKKAIAGHTFDVVASFLAFEPATVERDFRLFQGRAGQYIFISSASAYQKPPMRPFITESTPLCNPFSAYSRGKIACEDALMQRYRNDGFPVTIVRPSHTYNETSIPLALHGAHGPWQVLKRMRQGKPVPVHGDGASLWTVTHAKDFAKGFAGLAGNPNAVGQAVHITSDESLTWNRIHQLVAEALGCEAQTLHVPSDLLADAGAKAGYFFAGDLLGDKANSVIFDNQKIKTLVPEYRAAICFDEGVRESVKTYCDTPALQTEDPDFDLFCDRMAAAMQAARQATLAGANS